VRFNRQKLTDNCKICVSQMKSFGLCGLIAFAVSSALMPIAVLFSKRWGAVSETGGRHVGNRPIGRLGGLGVVTGITVAVGLISILDSSVGTAFRLQRQQIFGLMAGALLVSGVGFWDDIRRLPAWSKLLHQIAAAALAYAAGVRLNGIDLPLLTPFHLGWLGFPFTVLWIIGIVNAVNLIDGLDGLAGGVVFFASLVNLLAAITTDSIISAGIMAAVAGSMLGFLVYNWHPAKIYLGDGGAYALGFLLASSALLSPHQKTSTGVALFVPVLATGLPIFDTLLAMTRRALSRRGIFTPDRGHLHHVLLDAGISHRRVVIGLYTISLFLCSMAVAVVFKRRPVIGIFLILSSVVAMIIWGFAVRKNLFRILVFKNDQDA
jgi:UDP-GlcNAc:undecaprenyl-phosphate GlcNAc-1-phosphate transferase